VYRAFVIFPYEAVEAVEKTHDIEKAIKALWVDHFFAFVPLITF
jgi:hypothetical protein